MGTIFFFLAMIIMMGPSHFTDLFSPFLWKWMAIYAIAIVVLGQLTWQLGLKTANSTDLYIAEAAFPLLGLLFGYWILAKIPTASEVIGAIIIALGIALTIVGIVARKKSLSNSGRIASKQRI